MPAIDYAAARRQLCLAEVLALIDYHPHARSGLSLRGACPLHGSRSRRSRSFTAEPFVRGAPGQECLSLFPLRRRRQCPGLVGGPQATTAPRCGAGPVRTPGSARALAVRSERYEEETMTSQIPTIRERDSIMPAP